MKLHKHLVEQIIRALQDIFGDDQYADKVIEYYLKNNRKWGARDRRFFAESVYEITRWWRKYWDILGFKMVLSESNLLWIWSLYWQEQGHELPDWEELDDMPQRRNKLSLRASEESIPDWLEERGAQELGEKWPSILHQLNQKAHVYIRTNTLKTDRNSLHKLLFTQGISTKPVSFNEVGLVLTERKNVFATEAFKKGLFEVQDASSQWVAHFLDPKPGERIVDACAGAGGKSLHISGMMKNKGKIIAMDIHEWKLQELKRRAARGGVDIIETRLIDSTKVIKRLKETADALLLDVPCSGLGVLRRNPDTKWKLSPRAIEDLQKTQRELLKEYSSIVKKGGRMVYATCSILPSENEKQIEWFLNQVDKEWTFIKDMKISPQDYDGDGFYMALLEKAK